MRQSPYSVVVRQRAVLVAANLALEKVERAQRVLDALGETVMAVTGDAV